jgi:outer membrane protein assembly factor BamA
LVTSQAQTQPTSKVIEAIEFRGLHRTPQDSVSAVVLSKAGDVYNEEALRRDFTALWKTGRFTDIQLKTEAGAHGGLIVRFEMTERQPQLATDIIEAVEFRGLSAVTQETITGAILSKPGDVYDQAAVRRDVTALWKTDRFEDVQVKTETGSRGGVIVRFIFVERQ